VAFYRTDYNMYCFIFGKILLTLKIIARIFIGLGNVKFCLLIAVCRWYFGTYVVYRIVYVYVWDLYFIMIRINILLLVVFKHFY